MYARLPVSLGSSGWTVADSLCAVEKLCFDLIEPQDDSSLHLPHGPAAAACRLGMAAGDAVAIAAACELRHNASLIHDDLQDRDPTRRGRAAVWKIFGDAVAICTGDLLLSAAYAAIAGFSQSALLPEMLRRVHLRTAAAVRGQCADILPRSRYLDDVDTYERTVVGKSGASLNLPLELAMIGSGHRHRAAVARALAEQFAVGYQIVDDLEDRVKDANAAGAPSPFACRPLCAAPAARLRRTAVRACGCAG